MPHSEPVTKSFLIKALLSFIAFIILTLVPLAYQVGDRLSAYDKLSEIPPSDIIRSIKYSVTDQPARREFYRAYMEKTNLNIQNHDERLKNIESWSRDIKAEISSMRKNIESIEQNQAINTRILLKIEEKMQ